MDILIILTITITGMVITMVIIMDIGMVIMPITTMAMAVLIMALALQVIVQMARHTAVQDMIIYLGQEMLAM